MLQWGVDRAKLVYASIRPFNLAHITQRRRHHHSLYHEMERNGVKNVHSVVDGDLF